MQKMHVGNFRNNSGIIPEKFRKKSEILLLRKSYNPTCVGLNVTTVWRWEKTNELASALRVELKLGKQEGVYLDS